MPTKSDVEVMRNSAVTFLKSLALSDAERRAANEVSRRINLAQFEFTPAICAEEGVDPIRTVVVYRVAVALLLNQLEAAKKVSGERYQ